MNTLEQNAGLKVAPTLRGDITEEMLRKKLIWMLKNELNFVSLLLSVIASINGCILTLKT